MWLFKCLGSAYCKQSAFQQLTADGNEIMKKENLIMNCKEYRIAYWSSWIDNIRYNLIQGILVEWMSSRMNYKWFIF